MAEQASGIFHAAIVLFYVFIALLFVGCWTYPPNTFAARIRPYLGGSFFGFVLALTFAFIAITLTHVASPDQSVTTHKT